MLDEVLMVEALDLFQILFLFAKGLCAPVLLNSDLKLGSFFLLTLAYIELRGLERRLL